MVLIAKLNWAELRSSRRSLHVYFISQVQAMPASSEPRKQTAAIFARLQIFSVPQSQIAAILVKGY